MKIKEGAITALTLTLVPPHGNQFNSRVANEFDSGISHALRVMDRLLSLANLWGVLRSSTMAIELESF